MTTRPALVALPLLLPLMLAAAAPGGSSIEVEIGNVTSTQGNIHVDLCTQSTFLTSDCPYVATAPARIGTTIVTFANVPPGRYAAQVFHDRNNNNKIDRGLFGIPKEPVGFSNDAPIHMAPPKWDAAAFTHEAARQRIALKLQTRFF